MKNERMWAISAILVIISIFLVVTVVMVHNRNNDIRRMEAKTWAMKSATGQLSDLRSSGTGSKAVALKRGIEEVLARVGLKISDISLKESELEALVRSAYAIEAKRAYIILASTKSNPGNAEALRKQIFTAITASDKTLKEIGVSRSDVDRNVARNYLEVAARQGVKISATDYRAAGLKPHIIVKKVPVQKAVKGAKVVKLTPKK